MRNTSSPKLSICIATYMRGKFIAETLNSIVGQLDERCELVIVDGASPDDTQEAVRPFIQKNPNIRYIRESTNSGVDQDYDKAVNYATGDYCWLMTDDDLLVPNAIEQVMDVLCKEDDVDLVVANSQVRTVDFAEQLKPTLLAPIGQRHYRGSQMDALFAEVGRYLTFIGGVIIRRATWIERERVAYYGSLFVHVGVIFQSPIISSAILIREPLVIIRYGNAMWTARTFEIWMFKWPTLVWSFEHVAASARKSVSAPFPFISLRNLVWYRGIGGYAENEYRGLLQQRLSWARRLPALLVARMPEGLANAVCGLYCWIRLFNPGRMAVYDLNRARRPALVTKALARRLRLE